MSPAMIQQLSAMLAQMQGGMGRKSATVAELWDAYRKAKEGKLASFVTYKYYVPHLLRVFGDRAADSLTLVDLDSYRDLRRGELTQFKKGTKPATRNREVTFLKGLLNFGVQRGLLSFNPIAAAEDEEENNTRETILTEAQVRELCDRATDAVRGMILVAYDGGLRRKEVVTLRWDQVDLGNGLIHLWSRGTKTREARVTVLSQRAAETLAMLPRDPRCPFVFMNPETFDHYRPYFFYIQFRRLVEQVGIKGPDGRPYVHDCRRSFASLCRRRNLPESVIKRMGGWRTDEVFARYNIISIDDFVSARARLEVARADDLKQIRREPKKISREIPEEISEVLPAKTK